MSNHFTMSEEAFVEAFTLLTKLMIQSMSHEPVVMFILATKFATTEPGIDRSNQTNFAYKLYS